MGYRWHQSDTDPETWTREDGLSVWSLAPGVWVVCVESAVWTSSTGEMMYPSFGGCRHCGREEYQRVLDAHVDPDLYADQIATLRNTDRMTCPTEDLRSFHESSNYLGMLVDRINLHSGRE